MKPFFVFAVFASLFLFAGCIDEEAIAKERIKNDLVGKEIEYYGIAGNLLKYNITENDIKSIEKAELPGLKQTGWKVRVGEGLAWDFYYDVDGNFIKKEQLFRT